MKRIVTSLVLLASACAFAAQVCTLSPARPVERGEGFYTVGDQLYDRMGDPFHIVGVNRNHWDSYGSSAGVPLTGANTERVVLNFARPAGSNWGIVKGELLDKGIVPMPGNWLGTCKESPAVLAGIVDTWVEQASTWTQLNSTGLINIANEWGPPNSTVWRDSYVTAIARMRAAGYTGTLVVDSGGCGQDAQDIVKYGAAVLASDPLQNILFDVHVYGGFHFPATATWMQDYTKAFAALKATGLPILIGEFGPLNTGPSKTEVPVDRLVADIQANGWGWMPWSWDDNNLQGCQSNDNGFSMTTKCGTYTGNDKDELTAWGRALVPMIKANAKRVNWLH